MQGTEPSDQTPVEPKRIHTIYGFPICESFLSKFKFLHYIPFCPDIDSQETQKSQEIETVIVMQGTVKEEAMCQEKNQGSGEDIMCNGKGQRKGLE